MTHHHEPVSVDPQDLKNAQQSWAGFTALLKWGVVSTVVILILLAIFFV